jgi:hypothetical protein
MKNRFRRCSAKSADLRLMLAVLVLAQAGCASFGAKPWQHDLLAEHAMQVDPYPLQTAMDDHIYFSKEASSGGRSFAGGGCGCN